MVLFQIEGLGMPSCEIHECLCRLFLCRGYSWVHRFMDGPSKFLGVRHRNLFHDAHTALMLWAVSGDFKAFEASLLHLMLDKGLISPKLIWLLRVLGDGNECG